MGLSLGERLFIPLLFAGIYSILAVGFMVSVGGRTPRLKIIARYSILLILGIMYCMSWHEQLSALTGWANAWIGAAIILTAVIFAGCKATLSRRTHHDVATGVKG
ncbi:hypothetical protein Terro_3002 [Terriglobus roseus DSM 18391]|uniref:Uncharacterized protein n=2 Tax=Terriglobus roseus TaxID=392734 RepID=I3ZJ16_TERRK|nr:hypothetical protein Terro_3002 [Terriglobus roseus DSM 18391]